MSWYIGVFKKYADFNGRARRKEYWMFALFNTIIVMLLYGVMALTESVIPIVIYDIAILIPSLALCVRRMHDINKGGAWILISFIPLIGSIWFLVLTCTNGTQGANRFGSDPKEFELLDIA